jgi:O-antigen/teichoic acid export membrane protein
MRPLRRTARNFGMMARGRAVAGALQLLSVVVLARALSPTHFGYIVLIQTYVLVVRELFDLKLFEAIVRFGIPMIESNDEVNLRQLLRFALGIDFLTAVTATLVAVAATSLTARMLAWDDNLIPMMLIYSSVLLTSGYGTAKGVLRLYDRFDELGLQLMAASVLRLIAVLLVAWWKPGVLPFVVALTLASIVGNVYLNVRGWAELRRQVGRIALKEFLSGRWRTEIPGLWKFMTIIYWQANVDMLPKHLSTLLAGIFLGPEGAGLLRLAREITKILSKPGEILQQVLFPDLVRMWHRGANVFGSILRRALWISAAFGSFFVMVSTFGGAFLLAHALGEGYASAAPLLSLLMLAATFELLAGALRSAGYAMGIAGKILGLHLTGSVLYLVLFVAFTPHTGLIGPGLAACIASLVPLGGMTLLTLTHIRTKQTRDVSRSTPGQQSLDVLRKTASEREQR